MNAATFPIVSQPDTMINLSQQTPLARLLLEQALLMAQELEAVAAKAPKGQVLDCCEEAAIAKGREFIRLALQKTAQDYLAAQEKKRLSGPANAVVAAGTAAPTRKRS
jgi:hypothetical protein